MYSYAIAKVMINKIALIVIIIIAAIEALLPHCFAALNKGQLLYSESVTSWFRGASASALVQ